jgi:hypothetical protein
MPIDDLLFCEAVVCAIMLHFTKCIIICPQGIFIRREASSSFTQRVSSFGGKAVIFM